MKRISNNKLYYIRDSYTVEYEGADKKVRPYFCFSHSKNFALVFPITSQEGYKRTRFRRIPIPKEVWRGSKKSYIQLYDPKIISRNTPFNSSFKVGKHFSDFIRQSIISDIRAIKKIESIKNIIDKKEKIMQNNYENII